MKWKVALSGFQKSAWILAWGFGLSLFPATTRAAEATAPVQVEHTVSRFALDIFGEYSILDAELADISANVLGVGIRYAMGPKAAIGLSLAQGFSSFTSPQAIYLNFRTRAVYAILGRMTREETIISIDREPTFVTKSRSESVLSAEVALDQYFFNGSTVVAPGSGFTAGLVYDFQIWGVDLSASGRSGMIFVNQTTFIPKIFSVGVNFGF
jgi:hypothetical protein